MCVDFHSHLQPHKLNETRSSSVDYTNEHDNSANLSQSSSSFKSFSKFDLSNTDDDGPFSLESTESKPKPEVE